MPQKGEPKLKLVVIDGQGGGFGRAIIEALRAKGYTGEVLAVGTNALATSAMLKAGASAGATGENAAAVNAARAQVIAGPLGLVMANSMLGEAEHCHHDHFKDISPDTDWNSQTEHAEKIGLGSRKYELIRL